MQVVVIDQKGPKVAGYFVLATEIHDDSGARMFVIADCPIQLLTVGPAHTLEHLVFMVRYSPVSTTINKLMFRRGRRTTDIKESLTSSPHEPIPSPMPGRRPTTPPIPWTPPDGRASRRL
jgi:hypothetical protein